MLHNCDENSGRSSCSVTSIPVSPAMEYHFKKHHAYKANSQQQTNTNLVVSTRPRNHIGLLKSPEEKDPFPSCRSINRPARKPIANIFDTTRMRGISNSHSTLNIASSTQIENCSIGSNAVSMSGLNKDTLAKNKPSISNFKRSKPVQRAASRLYKAEIQKGKEGCVGPEFIVRALQPAKNIDLTISALCDKRVIIVVLLNGQRVEVLCDPNTITAGQIFEALVHSEKYEHHFMLGIAVLIGGDFVFLPEDYKIKKIAQENWYKSYNKKQKFNEASMSLTVFFRIKFFLPKNIATNIQGGEWRYRVYLQLRRATVEGQLISTIQNLIVLAGYALHIEFGEFSYREHGTADYFLIEHYLPESLITNEMANIKLQMKKAHESRSGLVRNIAVMNYITLAQTFRDYGAHFYSAVWATRDGFCRDVTLSIGPRGITLYSRIIDSSISLNTNRIVLQSLPWHHIHNFYHNKKSLYIIPNAYSGLSKIGIKYKLKIADNKSFFIFWLASLHHRLYLKLYAKEDFISYLASELNCPLTAEGPNNIDVSNYQDSYNLAVRNPIRLRRPARRRFKVDIFGEKKSQNKENQKPDTEELLRRILSPQNSDDSLIESPNGNRSSSNEGLSSSESSLPRRHGVKMGTRVFQGMKSTSINNTLRTPQYNKYARSEGDLVATQSDSDDLSSEQKQNCNVNSMKLLPERPYSQNMSHAPTAYVLESPKVYPDAFNYNDSNESCMNTSIFEKLDNMECVQSERIFVTAVLERDKANALGLQVAEGSDGNVYIKSITPDSAADSCEKLQPGDQIISVNGQTLLNLKYDKALSMLQSAPKKVELIVLQNIHKNNTTEYQKANESKAKEIILKKSIASIDTDLTDDELLNEEALKTIYALIKLTKEKVVNRIKDKSTPEKRTLHRCYSENRIYEESDLGDFSSQENTPEKRNGRKFNTWRGDGLDKKRRPLSLSIPIDNYLDKHCEEIFNKSTSHINKSKQSCLNVDDKEAKSGSVKNVALPRNFGLSRRWLGPVKYPVTPCKNSNMSAIPGGDVVRRHFVYGVEDSDEDQIFL